MDTKKLLGLQIDHYKITDHIARGGMADVYKAKDINLHRLVALKILLDMLAQDEQFVKRFQREALTVAKLDHPNIVQIYSTGLTPFGQPYLAMQYVDGGSMRDLLQRWKEQGKVAPAAQSLAIIRQLAGALDVAHRANIVHRDLKPSNVLIRSDGTPVLVDLGIAAITGGDKLTQTGSLMGTPHYMSPEQIRGAKVDGRSDLYSLGVILYELLAGIRPFEADESIAILHKHVYEAPIPLGQIRRDLSPQTQNLVAICLEKEPNNRYQSAAELIAAIDKALAAEGTGGYLPRTTVLLPGGESDLLSQPHGKTVVLEAEKNGRSRWVLGAVLAVAIVVFLLGMRWFTNSDGTIIVTGNPGLSDFTPTTEVATTPTPDIDTASESQGVSAANTTLKSEQLKAVTSTTEITLVDQATNTPEIEASPTPSVVPTDTPIPTPTENTGLPAVYFADEGSRMLLVPEGEFIMGSTAVDVSEASRICSRNPDGDSCGESEFASEMPQRTVFLSAFYIDETEVTNAQYKKCVSAGACNRPDAGNGRYDRDSYYDEASFADYPAVWVSWSDARDYCQWAGKRLPTEAEWEKAARGEDGRIFPWGDTFDSSRANTQERGSERITPVGQYPSGASPYGVLDMAGNVWEYVADWFDKNYYASAPDADPPGPSSSPNSQRVLRSGSYANYQQYARIANRGSVPQSSSTQFRGIRCAISANAINP